MHDDLSRYYLTLIFPEPRNIKSLRPKRHFLFYPTQDFRISSAPAIFFLQDKTSEVTVPKLSSPDYYSDRLRWDFGSRNFISACNLFFTRQDFRSRRPEAFKPRLLFRSSSMGLRKSEFHQRQKCFIPISNSDF